MLSIKYSCLFGGRAVYGVGLRPLACWDCGYESRRGHGCLSLVNVVWCQVEISVSGLSFAQRSPTDFGVVRDRESSILRRSCSSKHCCVMGEEGGCN